MIPKVAQSVRTYCHLLLKLLLQFSLPARAQDFVQVRKDDVITTTVTTISIVIVAVNSLF